MVVLKRIADALDKIAPPEPLETMQCPECAGLGWVVTKSDGLSGKTVCDLCRSVGEVTVG